jgi:hypothetical protein
MEPVFDPYKPLRILTIDGGGLQANSTLLILDELLNTIAETNGVRKPRPCDVFDVIAGIGTGAWLAILLGRFHMDITACLSEWFKITQSTTTNSKAGRLRMRVLKTYFFDPDRLVKHIDDLTKIYGSGDYLFPDRKDNGVRPCHVFVAALRSDGKGYNLFRTYSTEKAAKRDRLLEGPENPDTFTISRAFGVTGAAKYISPPWNEKMAKNGMAQFSDNTFPNPHNITELALDEIWGLFGTKVPLSAVINIGPSFPSNCDDKKSIRSFSLGFRLPPTCLGIPTFTTPRISTFGSVKDRKIEDKLGRHGSEIEADIKKKLDHFYDGGSALYYRLAPDHAFQGSVDVILKYLQLPPLRTRIDEIAKKMSETGPLVSTVDGDGTTLNEPDTASDALQGNTQNRSSNTTHSRTDSGPSITASAGSSSFITHCKSTTNTSLCTSAGNDSISDTEAPDNCSHGCGEEG